jgi:hypothetical protein
VYQSELDLEPYPYDVNDYHDYGLDTDVTDIMAYATDTTRFGNMAVFPIPSGLSYLKKNEIRYLPSGNKKDWTKLAIDRHLIQ